MPETRRAFEDAWKVIDPNTRDHSRLAVVDLLRGLALTMVLVDHIETLAAQKYVFRNWTLMGLGFADAADVFMFLSGFTLGWVYTNRMDQQGFWCIQRHSLVRTLHIYVSYLVTTITLVLLAWSVSRTSLGFALPLTVTSGPMLWKALYDAAGLLHAPIGALSILCTYMVVLPFLPGMLWLARRHWVIPMALSSSAYLAVQVYPQLNPGHLFFNPLAWQWLIVFGLVCGQRSRLGDPVRPHGTLLMMIAILVLGYCLATKKELSLFGQGPARVHFEAFLVTSRSLISKTNLGPLRVLHFLALATVAYNMLRGRQTFSSIWRPLVFTGRHSLTLYCAGVILTYLAACVAAVVPGSCWTLLLLIVDACLLQLLAAWLLERRAESGKSHSHDRLDADLMSDFTVDHGGTAQLSRVGSVPPPS